MSHRCLDTGDLADLAKLPPEHPRRREAEACARCGSLLRALETFLAGDPALPEAELAAAERRLSGVVAGFPVRRTGEPVTAARPGRRRPQPSQRWGWGLGLAAMLATVVFLAARSGRDPLGPNGVLRGGPPPADAPVELAVVAAAAGVDSLQLSWPSVAGALRYRVELFTAELDTLACLGPLAGPRVVVPRAALGVAGEAGGGNILCRVRALASGEVAVSRLLPVSVPAGQGR